MMDRSGWQTDSVGGATNTPGVVSHEGGPGLPVGTFHLTHFAVFVKVRFVEGYFMEVYFMEVCFVEACFVEACFVEACPWAVCFSGGDIYLHRRDGECQGSCCWRVLRERNV